MIRIELTLRLRVGREHQTHEEPTTFESQGSLVENAARLQSDGMDARIGFTRE